MTTRLSLRRRLLGRTAAAVCLILLALPLPADAAADPIIPGDSYYLHAHTSYGTRGTTYESWLGSDYVLLTNNTGDSGAAWVFDKDGENYRIRQSPGYGAWCVRGNDIKLTDWRTCSTRWTLTPAPNGTWHIGVANTPFKVTNVITDRGSWLAIYTIENGYREFTRFTFTRAI
ncbi:hypothetical protein [Herbidospora cretacea]|uniref:hypothetical protein n=1 Tax=Herbidospora cretacea TaxID=28444 RepID=UPI0007747687|nr:hypothetical protein [Herbidospora cretacea]